MKNIIDVTVKPVERYIITVHTQGVSPDTGEAFQLNEQPGGDFASLEDANRFADSLAHTEARDNPEYLVALRTCGKGEAVRYIPMAGSNAASAPDADVPTRLERRAAAGLGERAAAVRDANVGEFIEGLDREPAKS